MFKTIPSQLVSLLEQNFHMKITICACKYFEKCVNTDRNLVLYENIQKITIQKVPFTSKSTIHFRKKTKGLWFKHTCRSKTSICREMSRCDCCRVIQVIQSQTRLRLFDALKCYFGSYTEVIFKALLRISFVSQKPYSPVPSVKGSRKDQKGPLLCRLCFLLASPGKDQMEEKFRIKNTMEY